MKVANLAKVVYQAHIAYNESFEPWKHRNWEQIRDDEKDLFIEGIKFFLKNSDASEENFHNKWMKNRIIEGWSYGETYDPLKKIHPYLKPFDQLRIDQQFKDYLFKGLVNLFINKFKIKIEE